LIESHTGHRVMAQLAFPLPASAKPPGLANRARGRDREMARDAGHIVATFPDMDTARAAVSKLERGGIEASDVSVEGPPAERAARDPDPRPRDRGVIRHVGSRVFLGGVIGSVVGGAIGLMIGLLLLDGPAAVVASMLGGVIAGGAVGGVLGGYGSTGQGEDWEIAHQPDGGSVRVRVTVADPGDLERVEELLRTEAALSLARTDN
jgi:hypothetical protein